MTTPALGALSADAVMARAQVLGAIRAMGIEPRSKASFDAFVTWLAANPTRVQDVAAAYLVFEKGT